MPGHAAKPLDVGSGRVCASLDAGSAAWLSIGTVHPEHGFVELSALPRFEERRRGDSAFTRSHRDAMTLPDHGFLSVEIDGALPRLTADATDPGSPAWTGRGLVVRARTEPEARSIRQEWTVEVGPDGPPSLAIRLRGTLDRPALAEITELNPPQPTRARTSIVASGGAVRIAAPLLRAEAVVTVDGAAVEWAISDAEATGTVAWPDHASPLELVIEVALFGDAASRPAAGAIGLNHPDPLVARAVTYIRGCTALTLAGHERTILTDHRALPLSWTRDAYWQALALLAVDGPGDRERVADHLRWLWRRCERPDGRWVRSHHANGARKDLAFQADQQLYPIVELADYWRLTGALPDGVDWEGEVTRAWEAATEEIDAKTGLIATAENAADDPAAAPFITASQILLWYAAERVHELAEERALRIDPDLPRRTAATVRAGFDARIGAGEGPWPYAVDAIGARVAYHDANDLPVALAPLWGFCRPDDAGWEATMTFAFGPENPAWVAGGRPGLGSAHTPGPWTLGDVQAWIRARIAGDRSSMAAAHARLGEVAFADGMLPEAYSPDPGDDRRIRTWFAWPGAALAALRVLDEAGCLETRLAPRRNR